jgi:hypothetical protein
LAAIAVATFVAAWNPWGLLALVGFPWLLVSLAALTLWAILTALVQRRGRMRAVRVIVCSTIAALGAPATLLGLFAIAVGGPPFLSVRDEATIQLTPNLAIHRTVWNNRPFHTCVALQVRTGSGWATRFGPTTGCADQRSDRDWIVTTVGAVAIVVTRSDGTECTYKIDVDRRRLVLADSTQCPGLNFGT